MSASNANNHCHLQAKRITCQRGNKALIHDLSFAVRGGELWQIVGRNGVGKTTLLRVLTGICAPEQGEIVWCGQPINRNRQHYHKQFYYLGHTIGIKDELSVLENIHFALRVRKKAHNIQPVLAELDLTALCHVLARHLSRGQRQRVAVAKLILADVPLWLLDEPFASLDGVAVEKIQSIMAQKIAQGGGVVFTAHQALTVPTVSSRVLTL